MARNRTVGWARLAAVSSSLADLEPDHVGGESGSIVLIDRDAAGWGGTSTRRPPTTPSSPHSMGIS